MSASRKTTNYSIEHQLQQSDQEALLTLQTPSSSAHKRSRSVSTTRSTQSLNEAVMPPPGTSQRPTSPSTLRSCSKEAHIFQITTQLTRANILKQLIDRFSRFEKEGGVTQEQVNSHYEMLNRRWTEFHDGHDALGRSAQKSLLAHPYMVQNTYDKAFQYFCEAECVLIKINSNIKKSAQETLTTQSRTHLPDIPMPTFSGDFAQWPEFRDLFNSLVIKQEQLTNVEKLHYLKACLEDSAAQLIDTVPMSSDSFEQAWKVLIERYDDKEPLIMSYLDKLISERTRVERTAQSLMSLIGSTKQIIDSLTALSVPTQHWNYLFIYVFTQRLGKSLREAWEVQRSSLPKPTTITQLITFIKAKARALERAEGSSSTQPPRYSKVSATSSQQRTTRVSRPTRCNPLSRSAYHASTQPSVAQYPCDLCRGNHYIVTCVKFRSLSPADRHNVVVSEQLCFNCLGHHNLHSCNSNHKCKICRQRHHTMIHLAKNSSEQKH